MWEQEHRERSSYCQHENHCACYQSIREEHRHKLVQLIRIIQGIHDDRYGMVLTQGNKERKEKGKYENGNSPKKQKYF